MAATKHHDYHLVEPDPWPLIGAIAAGVMFSGAVMWFHDEPLRRAADGARPDRRARHHVQLVVEHDQGSAHRLPYAGRSASPSLRDDPVHRLRGDVLPRLVLGLLRSSIFPSAVDSVGGVWPPKGVEVMNPWGFPLLNTLILLCSGTTVTWAHHSLIHGDRRGLKLGLLLTILLGLTFTFVQGWEYAHAPFAFKGSIYGSTFFMATGFHGFHVIVGTIFLIVCLIRATAATSRRGSISGSKRPPGTGISSTSCGCSCSPRSTSGAAGARRTQGDPLPLLAEGRSRAAANGWAGCTATALPQSLTQAEGSAVVRPSGRRCDGMIGLGIWQLQRATLERGAARADMPRRRSCRRSPCRPRRSKTTSCPVPLCHRHLPARDRQAHVGRGENRARRAGLCASSSIARPAPKGRA